ncbi:Helix-turn-helix [Caldanaerobius fijiensis DSM 17918]|uniref:Helix-turn-helix n=1 Tax=Caldanaerobius fijiensis DSM 17918 TaxID=1121256 RepID=A0A1M4SV32_9THEO|nr:helix-turn-helix transcriptional regulator [Caldanaerobius fijiensis]SHE36065.1 Helix-turn-helix [Caldanaerobius fijiensis DSM 17918]
MFCKTLKKLRKSHNMTQDELAEMLNLSRSAISLYETGRREPDYTVLTKLADIFDVSVDFLLGRNVKYGV